ncbi:hypothetical protein KUW19_00595 [Ferrimonas balearica]|uniref:hypothetical protein n=1 Tax=Ferrimonas balearica TaxID=44012 RepID=UPI001C9444F2|nr:hypothetical protein [Ferrimonas balearica]MBY6104974.1 hypothetical protein [Ferrimonas balearica]
MSETFVEYVLFGGYEIELTVQFEVEPGQRAMLMGAPEDCQPGWEPEFVITSVKADGEELPYVMAKAIDDDLKQAAVHWLEEMNNG